MRRTLDSTESLSLAIIEIVADLEGTNSVALTPPLYDAIDPEALDALFTSRSETSVQRVNFEYAGYDIVVCGNGEVQVRSINKA